MKRITLTVIISHKTDLKSAEPVRDEILELLNGNSSCILFEKYEKIPSCFKAVFEVFTEAPNDQEFNFNLLTLSSSIARPWMIYFQNNFGTELIFNRTEGASYNRQNLNSIIWAHIQHSS